MATRVKIGDIFQIELEKGYAYGQITHKDSSMGTLIAVFCKRYNEPTSQYELVITDEVQFRLFYFASGALKKGLTEVVANLEVPDKLSSFPIFKKHAPLELTGGVDKWAFWSGDSSEETVYSTEITEEQLKYPLQRLVSHDVLIKYIEKGYRDYDHPTFIYK